MIKRCRNCKFFNKISSEDYGTCIAWGYGKSCILHIATSRLAMLMKKAIHRIMAGIGFPRNFKVLETLTEELNDD